MIHIPEIKIYQLVTGMLLHLKTDYDAAVDKSTTMLYKILNGINHYKKDYYNEAIALFTRGEDDPRKIKVVQFFNAERSNMPTVHITLPQDMSGENSLGGEASEVDEETVGADTYHRARMERRFDSLYHIVITSDNAAEVVLMYHTIRAMLISAFDTISLIDMENPKISGQDLNLRDYLVPSGVFARGIGLQASYEIQVPRWFNEQQLSDIIICEYDILEENRASQEIVCPP